MARTGLAEALFVAVLPGAPWMGGRVVRRHRHAAARLAAVAEEPAAGARRAPTTGRARRAHADRCRAQRRVAHALAEILVQAGAASKAIADDPDTATVALRAVRERGRGPVLELRRMLVLMRAGTAPHVSTDARIAPRAASSP